MQNLHLSDIHVCSDNVDEFPTTCNSINEALLSFSERPVHPDVLLITGDFTHTGFLDEYAAFRRTFLREWNVVD